MKLEKSTGLMISEEILKYVKRGLKDYKVPGMGCVYVGCFSNCREVGLTYMCSNNSGDSFTFCTYEHRNSDSIIVNGKKGYISVNGELPYKSESKWDYLESFDFGEYEKCGKFLAKEIKKFLNKK